MMYILSQKELDEHRAAAKRVTEEHRSRLQAVCTLAAMHAPVKVDWRDEVSPWGCILDEKSDPGYCDHCPVADICPHDDKRWSK